MLFNKKGAYWFIVIIILVLIGGLILFSFVNLFGQKLDPEVDIAACQKWVAFESTKLPITGTQIVGGGPSPCITEVKKIKKDGIEEIHGILAEDMLDCWDMYGRGKQDFFSEWDWGLVGETHCRVCDEIYLEEFRNNININDFEVYLEEHKPDENYDESYSEIFSGVKDAKIDFGEGEMLIDDTPLFILFTIDKSTDNSINSVLSRSGLVTIPIAIGTVAGGVIGFFGGGGVGAVPGATLGFKVGAVVGTALFSVDVAGKKSYFYPGLRLVQAKDINNLGCDDTYINKKKKEDSPIDIRQVNVGEQDGTENE